MKKKKKSRSNDKKEKLTEPNKLAAGSTTITNERGEIVGRSSEREREREREREKERGQKNEKC